MQLGRHPGRGELDLEVPAPELVGKAISLIQDNWKGYELAGDIEGIPIAKSQNVEHGGELGFVFENFHLPYWGKKKEISGNDEREPYQLKARVSYGLKQDNESRIIKVSDFERLHISLKGTRDLEDGRSFGTHISLRWLDGKLDDWNNADEWLPVDGYSIHAKRYNGKRTSYSGEGLEYGLKNRNNGTLGYQPVIRDLGLDVTKKEIHSMSMEEGVDFLFGNVMPIMTEKYVSGDF